MNTVRRIGQNIFVFCFIMLLCMAAGGKASATNKSLSRTGQLDGLSYSTDGTEVTVTGYTGNSPQLVIPEQINDLPVTGIAENAFQSLDTLGTVIIRAKLEEIPSCCFFHSSVENVVLPATVKCLGNKAFSDCAALKSISLPDGLETLEETAHFSGCISLKQIKLPEALQAISGSCFRGCIALEQVEVPEKVSRLGLFCFAGCYRLEKATLAEGLKKIEAYAFRSCYSLTAIHIPDSVSDIRENIFENCPLLTVYASEGTKAGQYAKGWHIPLITNWQQLPETIHGSQDGLEYVAASVTSEEKPAVASVTVEEKPAVASVTLEEEPVAASVLSEEESVVASVSMEDGLEKRCIPLSYAGDATDLVIPKKLGEYQVVLLPEYFLKGNTTVKNLDIQAELEYLSEYCLSYSALNTVKLPEGLKKIERNCFWECKLMTQLCLPSSLETVEACAFWYCLKLKEIHLPETLKTIGELAFLHCDSLEQIIVPEGIKKINYNTFEKCTSLKRVCLPEHLQEIDYRAFLGCSALESVYISENVTTIAGADNASKDFAFAGCPTVSFYAKEDSYAAKVGAQWGLTVKPAANKQEYLKAQGMQEEEETPQPIVTETPTPTATETPRPTATEAAGGSASPMPEGSKEPETTGQPGMSGSPMSEVTGQPGTSGSPAPEGTGQPGTSESPAPEGKRQPGTSGSPAPEGIGQPGTSGSPAPEGTKQPGTSESPAPEGKRQPGTSGSPAPEGIGQPGTSGSPMPQITEHPGATALLVKAVDLRFKVSTRNQVSIRLSWQTVNGVQSYTLYRAAKRSGNYQKITELVPGFAGNSGQGEMQYIDKNIKARKKYYYKLVLHFTSGDWESGVRAYQVNGMFAPKYHAVRKKYKGSRLIRIRIGKHAGQYVQIAVRIGKKNYRRISLRNSNIKQNKKTFNLLYQSKSKRCKVRIRTYRKTKGKRVYSPWSKEVCLKMSA